jgi:hypothetical protein
LFNIKSHLSITYVKEKRIKLQFPFVNLHDFEKGKPEIKAPEKEVLSLG